MEGVSHEACALAGHLGLGKLVVLYDDNGISIDGPTSLSFSEDVPARFAAYGWHVQRVDGHDFDAVEAAIAAAKAQTAKPSLVACRTHIGFGSPNRQDTSKAHGEPLGADEIRLTKERLGWPADAQFLVPDEVRALFGEAASRGAAEEGMWNARVSAWRAAFPELAAQLDLFLAGSLPEGWEAKLPAFPAEKPLATRSASGAVLDALVPSIPDARRRLGRPDAVEQHAGEDGGRREGRRLRGLLPALRDPRARHGRDPERPRPPRLPALRRHVPRLRRLHEGGDPPRGAHGAAGRLRLHARLDRPRRGRPDAPARRAARRRSAPRRTSSSTAPPTRTRRPPGGASPSGGPTARRPSS